MIHCCPSAGECYRRIGVGVNSNVFPFSKKEKREKRKGINWKNISAVSPRTEGKWLLSAFRGKDERKGLLEIPLVSGSCVCGSDREGGIRRDKRTKERERERELGRGERERKEVVPCSTLA